MRNDTKIRAILWGLFFVIILFLLLEQGCAKPPSQEHVVSTVNYNLIQYEMGYAFMYRLNVFKALNTLIQKGEVKKENYQNVAYFTASQVKWATEYKQKYPDDKKAEEMIDKFITGCKKDLDWLEQQIRSYDVTI